MDVAQHYGWQSRPLQSRLPRGLRLPGDSQLKPEVLPCGQEVLLFLLLAEQTEVTWRTCVRAEDESQSLALTTADAALVPDLLLTSWSQ